MNPVHDVERLVTLVGVGVGVGVAVDNPHCPHGILELYLFLLVLLGIHLLFALQLVGRRAVLVRLLLLLLAELFRKLLDLLALHDAVVPGVMHWA
jgi:hypothetical protein